MAVDTAPAAVPGPGDKPAGSSGPAAGGLLSSLLTPVEPARPAASLAGTGSGAATDVPATAAAGMSSDAFHDTPDTTSDDSQNSSKAGGTNTGKKPPSVIRAWLLAGAERWKKNGGANIKRLEVKKARAAADAAAARQMKQSLNLAPRPATAPAASSGGGKGPAKSPVGRTEAASRNSALKPVPAPPAPKAPGPAKATAEKPASAAQPAPAPRSTTGSKAAEAKTTATNPAPTTKTPGPAPAGPTASKGAEKPGKPGAASTDGGGRPSAGKAPEKPSVGGSKGSFDAAGKPAATAPTKPSTGVGTSGSGTGPKGTGGSTADKAPITKTIPAPRTAKSAGAMDTPDPKTAVAPKAREKETSKTAPGPTTDKEAAGKNGSTAIITPKPTTGEKSDAPKTSDTDSDSPGSVSADIAEHGPMLTRDARETGYRDGTRAARTAAKARAYKHGVHDGWHAVMDAADDEKTLLDHARDLRKEQKDPPMTTMPLIPPPLTSPPAAAPDNPAPAAQPLTVTGVDATTVHLGADALKPSMARGEVRTLKGFERRLTEKHDQVQIVAEQARGLALHASEQAKQVTALLEQAKAVKGGAKLVNSLVRLQDNAQAQVVLAEEIHARAVRSADATSAVLANAITRYGSIYQAVVDSDETAPAELNFYKR